MESADAQLIVANQLEQLSSSAATSVEESIAFIEQASDIRRTLLAEAQVLSSTDKAAAVARHRGGLAQSLLALGRLQLRRGGVEAGADAAAAAAAAAAKTLRESVDLLRSGLAAAPMRAARRDHQLCLASAIASLAAATAAVGRRDAPDAKQRRAAQRAIDAGVEMQREALALRTAVYAEDDRATTADAPPPPPTPRADVALALRALAMALAQQKGADASGRLRIDEAIERAAAARAIFAQLGPSHAKNAEESAAFEKLLRGLRPARAEQSDAALESSFNLVDADSADAKAEGGEGGGGRTSAARAARAWLALPAAERAALLGKCAALAAEAAEAKAAGNVLLKEQRVLEAVQKYRDVALTPCARALALLRKAAPPLRQLAAERRKRGVLGAETEAGAAAVGGGADGTQSAQLAPADDGAPLARAVELWEQAQAVQVSLWLNLAQCCVKLEQWRSAATHCSNVLRCARPQDGRGGAYAKQALKALYRRALARSKIGGGKSIAAARADIRAARELGGTQRNAAVERLAVSIELLRGAALRTEEPLLSRMAQALGGGTGKLK